MAVLAMALSFGSADATPRQSPPTSAPATSQAADSAFEAALASIGAKASAIEDLTADFVQVKRTPLLRKPLESRGVLRVKGDRMRWDTSKPVPGVMMINQTELQLYSPREELLEIYPMEHGLSQLAGSPLPRLQLVREHFRITPTEWPGLDRAQRERRLAMRLTPLDPSLGQHIQEVLVLLNMDTGCAECVQTIDPEGEVLEIQFSNVRLNTKLSDDAVRFEPPPGTTISRPLEPGRPQATSSPGRPAS